MKITESKLRQIIRAEVLKTLSETSTPSSTSEKISNQLEKLSPEMLMKLQKDLESLQTLASTETDITESETVSRETPKSTLEKMLGLLSSKGELNIPATATNALLIAPILAMKGELGAVGISAAVGLLLDLVNNTIQKKFEEPA